VHAEHVQPVQDPPVGVSRLFLKRHGWDGGSHGAG
jgi:hypothetical protein